MRFYSRYILLFIIYLSASGVSSGECRDDSTSMGREFSAIIRGAVVLPSNPMIRGKNGFGERMRSVFGVDIRYSFNFPINSDYGKLYPFAYQGAGLGFTDFIPSRLSGKPINLYVMQGYKIADFNNRLSLNYEWNFGASFGWNKINSTSPSVVDDVDGFGSSVNAYINLAFLLKYRVSNRISLILGMDISHFSNGNTSYPNPGVNVIWGRIGAIYSLTQSNNIHVKHHWESFSPHWVLDFTLYGAWKKGVFTPDMEPSGKNPDYFIVPGHFGVAGLSLNPLYRFNPIFSAGISLDAQYDESANISSRYVTSSSISDPYFYKSSSFFHQCLLGLSVRAELTMPIFSLNIGIGHSLAAPGGPDLKGLYQTFTLKSFITKNLYLNTGYRLVKFKNPGNLMLGAGYRFIM